MSTPAATTTSTQLRRTSMRVRSARAEAMDRPRRRPAPRPQLTHMIWTISMGLYADHEAEL